MINIEKGISVLNNFSDKLSNSSLYPIINTKVILIVKIIQNKSVLLNFLFKTEDDLYLPNCSKIKGIMVTDAIKQIVPNNFNENTLKKISLTTKLKETERKSIKFQKFALFNLPFNKFIVTPVFSLISLIISYLKLLVKPIFYSVLYLGFITEVAVAQMHHEEQINIKKLIKQAENKYDIPYGLLQSIAKIESGFKPYVLCLAGKTINTKSKEEAKIQIEELISSGQTNIDIGPMQVNYYWHKQKFANLDQMLDIEENIQYAAKLLSNLYIKHKSWRLAVKYYHSANSVYHKIYSKKIILAWLELSTNQKAKDNI